MDALNQPPHLLFRVVEPEDVGAARRRVAVMASEARVDAALVAQAQLAVTELGNNLLQHAEPGGWILTRALAGARGTGVEVLSVDRGPGIADVDLALNGAVAAPAGLGCGLAGVRRVSTEFDIYSRRGAGTVVLARFHTFAGGGAVGAATPRWSGLSVAIDGTTDCGDAWAVTDDGGRTTALLVDGLGHGPGAAEAARVAVDTFAHHAGEDLESLAQHIHAAMRVTRGGAAALCRLDVQQQRAEFVGVGNVAGRLVASSGGSQAMVSNNGTLGTELATPRIRRFDYQLADGTALVMSSDGVRDGFPLDEHPGLFDHDPLVVAAVIHGQCTRGTDDATVVVVHPLARVAA